MRMRCQFYQIIIPTTYRLILATLVGLVVGTSALAQQKAAELAFDLRLLFVWIFTKLAAYGFFKTTLLFYLHSSSNESIFFTGSIFRRLAGGNVRPGTTV
ncbi:hypothetical protein GCM10028773_57520 [Spirosoma koreense]